MEHRSGLRLLHEDDAGDAVVKRCQMVRSDLTAEAVRHAVNPLSASSALVLSLCCVWAGTRSGMGRCNR